MSVARNVKKVDLTIPLCNDYTAKEIAEKLQCSTASVYSICKRAGQHIKPPPSRELLPPLLPPTDHDKHLERMKRHEKWQDENIQRYIDCALDKNCYLGLIHVMNEMR